MENTTTYKVIDAVYSQPKAGANRPGLLMFYGEWHQKSAEFGIMNVHGAEQIYVRTPKKRIFKQIVFDLAGGTYDEKGIRRIGVYFIKDGNGLEFSLHIQEIIDILRKLGSQDVLEIWENQLRYKSIKDQPGQIESMLSDKNLTETKSIPETLYDIGFVKGDVLLEYHLNHFIISYQDKIVVDNPRERLRTIINVNDFKQTERREYSVLRQQEELEEARLFIKRTDASCRSRK